VLAALFGLIGVLLGAVIGGFVSYTLEHRRETAEARSAARLSRAQIGEARRAADTALEDGSWPIAWQSDWTNSWQWLRRPLAGSLEPDHFDLVATTYTRMGQLERGLAASRPARHLSDTDRRFLGTVVGGLEETYEMLGPYRN
jgi:hypothetical protein